MENSRFKFRAWVPRDKEMFHVRSILFDKELVALAYDEDDEPGFFEHYDDIVLMQYTGLKDKNGVEIYEGDIVTADTIFRCIVKYWDEGFSGYVLTFGADGWEGMLADYGGLEVIGNIYENPELLEV